MLKAPFLLPPDFLADLDYPAHGGSPACTGPRWVMNGALTTASGQVVGVCDHWLYLSLIRRPDVAAWLDGNHLHLGNPHEKAEH